MNRAFGLMLARGWMNVCAIGSFLVVGRFLSPSEFGIYALASSGIMLPMTLIGAGFADHVISRDQDKQDEATAFWATAALGAAFSAVALIAALILPSLGLVEIGSVLLVLSPLPLLWGFSAILEAMLIRDDRTGVMAAITMSAETIGLVVLLAAVMGGFGVMSLAISRLANNGLLLVIYWALIRPPNPRRVNREAAGRLSRFSLGVIGARIMNWADAYGVEFVLGAFLPTALIGFYRMAGRLSGAATSILVFAPWQAQLAYLGDRIRAAPHRTGVALLRALQMHMALIAPLFAGLAVLAPDVVALLLGPQWAPAGIVLSIMSITAILQVVYGNVIALLIARGHTRRLFYLQVVLVAATIVALTLGAAWGLVGVAFARFIASATVFLGACFALTQIPAQQRGRIARFFIALTACCAALVGAMLALLHVLPAGPELMPTLARIVGAGLAGLGAYAVALWFIAPGTAQLLRLVLAKRLRRRPGATLQAAAQDI